MTRLSDTQLVILSAAAQREDRNVLPLPGSLRGGAAAKVIGALLSRGLIAETTTDSQTKADAALNRIWRNDEDGRAILLHITEAGLAAIGVEPEGGDSAPTGACRGERGGPAGRSRRGRPRAQGAHTARGHEAGGPDRDAPPPRGRATIAEIVAATGWRRTGSRRHRRGAEEETRAGGHLREG